MFYFDKGILAQYLDQCSSQMPLKVYSNSEWYTIADQRDLSDDITGIGYDVYGGDHRFDYRDIQQIKVGNNPPLDLKGLQDLKAGQPAEPEAGGEKKSEEEPAGEEPSPEEEPPTEDKPEKEPDLSWYSPAYDIGRKIINEAKRRK